MTLGRPMTPCVHCQSSTLRRFYCNYANCPGVRRAIYICEDCHIRGCPYCNGYIADYEIWTDSSLTLEPEPVSITQHLNPSHGLSEDLSSQIETHSNEDDMGGENGLTETPIVDKTHVYFILLDLKYTLVQYRTGQQDLRESFRIRPFACDVLHHLLKLQEQGVCQMCFHSTLAAKNAIWMARQLLEKVTSTKWNSDNEHRSLRESTSGKKVWLLHGEYSQNNPWHVHEKSGTPMQIKDLESVFYEFEDMSDDAKCFSRSSLVFLTCAGTTPGRNVDEASAKNLLKVKSWHGSSQDQELQTVLKYFHDFFVRRPSDARIHLHQKRLHQSGAEDQVANV